MAEELTLLDPNKSFPIPPDVELCPICRQALVAAFDEWIELADHTWQVSDGGMKLTCVTEPTFGQLDWFDFIDTHYAMPYVDWAPVEAKILAWINERYRFKMSA